MKTITTICAMIGMSVLAASLTGCAVDDSAQYRKPAPPIHYDVAPQVIYRIDDHRYVQLENYDRCNGQNYYIDTRAGIRTEILTGNLSQYSGRLINADPTGMNIVIPEAPGGVCGDKGCNIHLGYSTDGGRTFKYKKYMQSANPPRDSKDYSILVGRDGFYVVITHEYAKGKVDNRVVKFPLIPGIDLERPYPEGRHDEYLSNKPLPSLKTPSGQERFSCDASIRPSNLSKAQ